MSNPFRLNEVENFGIVGKALYCVIHSNIFKQAEKMLSMANICYLCLSKAIQNYTEDIAIYRDKIEDKTNLLFDSYINERDDLLFESYVYRAELLSGGKNLFQYEIITAFKLMQTTIVEPFLNSNRLMNDMEISDIESILEFYGYEMIKRFEERKQELEKQFSNNKDVYNRAIERGISYHNSFQRYLEDKVLKQGNVIFRPRFS